MEKFRKLGIIEPILKSIQEQNFENPSEIQEKSIPLIIEGKDVIAGAATGSGKTLVFASGIIKNAEHGKGIQALVLTPTRELAEQVSTTLQRFSKNKYLEIIAVYGGVSINPQIEKLETADVVVGTPGRILDHINRRTIQFDDIKILVLDEADRMLDMGFKDDVEKIINQCPKKRQTLLFSATITRDVSILARKYMDNPAEISAEVYVDPSKLSQVYYDAPDNLKFSLLVHFLKHEKSGLAMVFCNTQRNTDFVANNLRKAGIDVLAIHGGYSQDRRSRTMQKFSSLHASVLVCTDVAARGLDIKGVSHIYNYDMPKDDTDYIHRIGRTARAGKEGKVINILASRDYDNFSRIIRNRELNITKEEMPQIERVFIKFRDDSRDRFRGRDDFRRENRFKPRSDFRSNSRDNFRPRNDFKPRSDFRKRDNFSSRSDFKPRNDFRKDSGSFKHRNDYHKSDSGPREKSFGSNSNRFKERSRGTSRFKERRNSSRFRRRD